jgi:hypothetical protein
MFSFISQTLTVDRYLFADVLISLLGAFEKLRKATISFTMSVCPTVRMEQLGSHGTDFHET